MSADSWKRASLPDVIDFQEGPGILAKDFREVGVPLIRLSGLDRGATSLLDGCNFLDPAEVARRWDHFRVSRGDTLLSTSASLGRIGVVDERAEGAIPYTGIIRMRPRDGRLRPAFIRYLLESPDFQVQVEAMGVGSVIRHFGPSHLREMTVPVLDPSDQDAIAAILGALDDKIDLNRKMNATLDAMARALFKSWFVAFDSVRAKAEGRAPVGMDAATAALFPSALIRSEVGEIPEGWSARALDSVAAFLNGLALQKWPAAEGEPFYPVIKIAQLRAGTVARCDKANREVPRDYLINDGDLLFSWSGSLLVRVWAGGLGALNQHLFKVTSAEYPRWFVRGWLDEHLPTFQRIAAGKATTMGHIQRHHLTEAKVVVPPHGTITASNRSIGTLDELLVANEVECRTLAVLRELLLPKLLSGELRVRDAEKVVGQVA